MNNFGGFNSFVIAKVEKVSPQDIVASKITFEFTDFAQRLFKGSGLFKDSLINGFYTVTYSDGYIENCGFHMKPWPW
jgi:D-lyxose ketol-isomerase